MSAYIVSKAHIDALVATATWGAAGGEPQNRISYYHDGERVEFHAGCDEDALGQMLWGENVASVAYRYPTDDWNAETQAAAAYRFERILTRHRRLTAVHGLKALRCYEYQSCEHPGWEKSSAKAFCDEFRLRLCASLPGYDEAPWEITDEREPVA